MQEIKGTFGGARIHLLQFGRRRVWEDWLKGYKRFKIQPNERVRNSLNTSIREYVGRKDESWLGKPAPKTEKEVWEHERYFHMEEFKAIKAEVNRALRNAERLGQINQVSKKKLQFNDLGIGVFSFDRAAMGLRRTPDTTELGREYVKLQIELFGPGAPIDEPKRTISEVRKSFAWFPPKEATTESVKLYIICGALGTITGDQMIYNGIAPMLIAEYLVDAGMNVEVNAIINTQEGNDICGSVFTMKPYDGELNLNDCLLVSSDPRFYRSKGFANHIQSYDHFGKAISSSLGSSQTAHTMRPFLEQHNRDEAIPVLLERVYSRQAVITEINRVLDIVKQKRNHAGPTE